MIFFKSIKGNNGIQLVPDRNKPGAQQPTSLLFLLKPSPSILVAKRPFVTRVCCFLCRSKRILFVLLLREKEEGNWRGTALLLKPNLLGHTTLHVNSRAV